MEMSVLNVKLITKPASTVASSTMPPKLASLANLETSMVAISVSTPPNAKLAIQASLRTAP